MSTRARHYLKDLETIDGWLFDRMANDRVRLVIEGEVSGSELSVTASLYERRRVEWEHVTDGFGSTPVEALLDLIKSEEL